MQHLVCLEYSLNMAEATDSVKAEITVTKVFITVNMKNSKLQCKQEVDVR
jgi:hypothetical protein